MAEVCSLNPGKISFTIDGEESPRELDFRRVTDPVKGVIGHCENVQPEEAEHLLGKIGAPAFFKPGAVEVKTAGKGEGGDEGKKDEGKKDEGKPAEGFSLEAYQGLANANQLKSAIKEFGDAEVLKECIQAEANRESGPRDTWMAALEGRLEALTK